MIAYSTFIELETNLIHINCIRKTMEAVAAGIATIPSEDDKTDILYFLSESLSRETDEALDKFRQVFEAVREQSYRTEAHSIDNP